ncbi:AAA family ATPase [Kiloniella laminariae]|uniref:AAA family ATPase n=1 Tax=Kiloniella laminariae TaxID=454162 RepID=A0ABT4LEY5_9PROT|nr:AAA family ATPase [Kiloniella laminariae]MCZ4279673.1 AAA family ATPase [Kiloniella laminariae]
MMIRSIDIGNFGAFKDFSWRAQVRDHGENTQYFKKLNIIYGRNYSGKTTLSRILRSYETGTLPPKYKNISFDMTIEQNTYTHKDLSNHSLDIRVYNKDFVTENLQFLSGSNEGEIRPFAILGSENIEIKEKIEKEQTTLGSIENKSGLRYEALHKKKKYDEELKREEQLSNNLKSTHTRFANDIIKSNRDYGDAKYNINKLYKDIEIIQTQSITKLDSYTVNQYQKSLLDTPLPDILFHSATPLSLENLYETSKSLLEKRVIPTKPIQELLDNPELQAWVKTGINLHKNKKSECGFCRSKLSENLFDELSLHFDKNTEEFEKNALKKIKDIEEKIHQVNNQNLPDIDSFYENHKEEYKTINKKINEESKQITENLCALKSILSDRINNPNTIPADSPKKIDETGYRKATEELKELISKNKAKTQSLAKDNEIIRNKLRLNHVLEYMEQISLLDKEAEIKSQVAICESARREWKATINKINNIEENIRKFEHAIKDENKGAEKINALLNHYFGHKFIELRAEKNEDAKFRFSVFRNNIPAFNLSEGECSLIAFCYFIAKLEDTETAGKNLTIYIDDPISSLDSNHIFYIFSLIEKIITAPVKNENQPNTYKYQQLFISTHNLEFLKYLKQISIPKIKINGKDKLDYGTFIIERSNENSKINIMPIYLKEHITEFNYLFHQIFKCKDEPTNNSDCSHFYSFGNNLRKFLEIYLYFKYPSHKMKDTRLQLFFEDDPAVKTIAERITNELSHLDGGFERGMNPIDIPEITKLSNYILEKIRTSDKEQYNALLDSIGVKNITNLPVPPQPGTKGGQAFVDVGAAKADAETV